MELFGLLLKLLVALIVILSLIFLLYKVSYIQMNQINKNKYIKVLERTQIAKDVSIVLIKMGSEGYVILQTNGNSEVIKKLEGNELQEYENNREQINYENVIINYFKSISKDEKHE